MCVGTDASRQFVTRLIKQVDRYKDEFGGPGAVIYRLGYSDVLPGKVAGAILLGRCVGLSAS
jgi:hypothetical protein